MNFTSRMEGQDTQLELKYCERCGGLWLRLQGNDGAYCASCRANLGARPNPGQVTSRKTGRRKVRPREDVEGRAFLIQARIECLQGVAAMQVTI